MSVLTRLVSSCSFLAFSGLALSGLALSGGAALAASATPTGGQFAAGSGSISPTANGLSINQSSSRGIINWQSFSIGQGNTVNIANGSGATLNRVTGVDISTIAGSLTSTGSVYLINPAGVVVTPTGRVVATGSFVASTRDVADGSFMAGGTLEFTGASGGTVVNQGRVASSTGDVVLIGQSVTNSGQVSAPNGMAALAAADDLLLRQGGDQAVLINAGTGNVTNSGAIAAAQAQLAAAGGNVYALAVNNGGVIRATGTTTTNGHVYLTADGDVTVAGTVAAINVDGSGGAITATAGPASGTLTVTGVVSASATGKTAKGGAITLTAATVNVGATAHVSATGGGDGGAVLIGGDRHGGSTPSQDFSATPVANATTTTVAAGASISASGGAGGGSGNGGNVVVWSNQSTSFAGAIAAKGGAAGGNGGFVEVSGEQLLGFTGTVDTSAPLGATGTLLLDPADVTIYSSTDASGTAPTATTGESQSGGTFTPSGANSFILNTDIDAALATNNVAINTGSIGDTVGGTGNIHFGTNGGGGSSNAAPIHWSNANTLTLNAVGVIDMPGGSPTSATGGAATPTTADPNASTSLIDAQGGGAITFNAGAYGQTGSSALSPTSAVQAIIVEGNIEAHGGAIEFNATEPGFAVQVANGYIVSNTMDNGAGSITIQADFTRLGSGGFSGQLVTTGNVFIEPLSAGAVSIGNNSTNNYNSPNNTTLIDNKSISLITAANLVIGSDIVTGMTIETTHTPLNVNAPNVGNLEFVTGPSGSITQDSSAGITIMGGAGGLAASTGGLVALVNPLNQFAAVAVQAGGNVAVEGNTTASAAGSLSIGTVNGISGITTTGAGATTTLINSGTVTQDTTSAANLISTPNLVVEGGGSFALNNLSNAISNVAGSVASLSLTDNAALSTASLSDELSSPTTYGGVSASGAVTIVGDQSVTIGSGAPIATTGGNVMAEAGTAAGGTVAADSGFVNGDGAAAFNVTGGGAWRVYSQDPRDNSLGGLTSSNYSFVQYDAPNSYGAPGAATTFTNANAALNMSASGNGFLYGVSPTVTATVTNAFTKVYDATTALPGSGSVPLAFGAPVITVGGMTVTNLGSGGTADTVTLNQSATLPLPAANFYPSKDVGTYTIGVGGVSLQSATDSNGVAVYGYNVTPNAAGAATITPKPLTVAGLLASSKTYDATPIATLTGSAALQSAESPGGNTSDGKPYTGDPVTLSGTPTATFSQSNVGNSLPVSVSGLSLANNTAGDYTLAAVAGLAANIYPAPLIVMGTKVYDGAEGFVTGELSITGGVGGQTVALTAGAGASSSQNVGTYAGSALTGLMISVTGGMGSDLASNYQLPATGALTITPAPLTITADPKTKAYGTDDPALTFSATGFVPGDNSSSVTYTGALTRADYGTLPGEQVGSYAITQGTLAISAGGNYAVTSFTGNNLAITPASLTIAANPQSKTYGTSDPALTYATSGLVSTTVDGVALADTISGALARAEYGTLPGEQVGSYAIGQGSVAASDPGNYTTGFTAANLTITPASLTIAANPQSKVYGTSDPALTYATSGLVSTTVDGVALADTISGALARAEYGTLPGEQVGSYAIGQGSVAASDPGNYTTGFTAANLTITPASLTITANPQSKTYGTSDPALTYATSGLVSTTVDGVALADTISGALTRAEYGTLPGEQVGSYAIGQGSVAASDPGNYTTGFTAANLTITPASLTIAANPQSKVYGTSDPALTYATSGLVSTTVDGVALADTISGALTRAEYGTLPGEQVGSYAIGQGSVAASDPGNYTTGFTAANLTITPASLTIAANPQSKVYGTSDPALTYATSGLVSTTVDGVALADTISGALTRAEYGTLPGEQVGSYAIGQGSVAASDPGNYTTGFTAATLTITPASLTVTANPQSKTYGTSDPALTYATSGLVSTTVDGVALADTISGALARAEYGTLPGEQVGSYAIGQGSVAASDPGNYTTGFTAANLTITPASLTVTANPQSKVYGTSDPALTYTASGFVNVTADGVPLADTPSSVNYTGALTRTPGETVAGGPYAIAQGTLALSPGSNYALASFVGNDLTITPKTLIFTGTRVYDGGTDASASILSIGGDLDGSNLTVSGLGVLAGKDVGSQALTATGGALNGLALGGSAAGNYTLTGSTGSVTVTPLAVVLTGTRLYDGGTDASSAILSVANAVSGDTVDVTSGLGSTSSRNVGTQPIGNFGTLALGNNTAGDYTIVGATGAVLITPESLTITATNQTKVYDGTTISTNIPTLTSGMLQGADTLTSLAQAYASRNVLGTNGSTLNVTNYTLSDPGNYTVTTVSAPGTITPEPLTVTAAPTTKTYNGATGSPGTPTVTAGTLYGPDTGSFTQTYTTPNAGTGLTLTPTGTIADGNGGDNYAVTYVPVTTGVITPEPLTITAASQTKIYDGTVTSTGIPTLTSGALENGDTLTSLGQAYASKNVLGANGSTINVTFYALTNATNYTVTEASAPGTITPLAIVVAGTRVYDAATDAAATILKITNVAPGDTVALGSGTGVIAGKNVGPEAVTGAGTLTLANNGAGDYALAGLTGMVTVTPLAVTVSGMRVYDGGVDAASPILTIAGDLDGSNLTLSGAGTLISRNVGPETIAALGTLALGGGASGNYRLTGGVVTITPEPLTVTAVPTSKTYSGTTGSPGAPVVTSGTVYGPDTGNFTETYNTPNAGAGLTLTPSGPVSDGNGGNNYTITYAPISTGVITPRPVLLTGVRPFDGSVNAPAAILTVADLAPGDAVDVSGGTGILVNPATGIEALASFGTLTLAGPSAGNYTFTGGAGRVIVTGGFTYSFPPLDSTDSGIGLTPFTDAIYDGGILHLAPRQNGIVTGTIATIDGVDQSPDTVLACTMGSQDTACLQNGVASAPGASPAQAN